MSWKEWMAVVLVIGVGVLAQIVGHDEGMSEMEGEGHEHAVPEARSTGGETALPPALSDAEAGPYRTIVLEVTGMT